jgi:hypothetical protein
LSARRWSWRRGRRPGRRRPRWRRSNCSRRCRRPASSCGRARRSCRARWQTGRRWRQTSPGGCRGARRAPPGASLRTPASVPGTRTPTPTPTPTPFPCRLQAELAQASQQQRGAALQEASQLSRQAQLIEGLVGENRELVAKLTSLHGKMRSYKAAAAKREGELRGRDAEVGGCGAGWAASAADDDDDGAAWLCAGWGRRRAGLQPLRPQVKQLAMKLALSQRGGSTIASSAPSTPRLSLSLLEAPASHAGSTVLEDASLLAYGSGGVSRVAVLRLASLLRSREPRRAPPFASAGQASARARGRRQQAAAIGACVPSPRPRDRFTAGAIPRSCLDCNTCRAPPLALCISLAPRRVRDCGLVEAGPAPLLRGGSCARGALAPVAFRRVRWRTTTARSTSAQPTAAAPTQPPRRCRTATGQVRAPAGSRHTSGPAAPTPQGSLPPCPLPAAPLSPAQAWPRSTR